MWKPARQAAAGHTAADAGQVDVDAAWAFERAVCNPEFDPRYRLLLIGHYVLQRDVLKTCRELGIPLVGFDAELWRAAMSIRNRVQKG